jgi:hypothetical protein
MKPTCQTKENGPRHQSVIRKFPVTDFNYHSVGLDGYHGHCAKVESPSFYRLTRDYFKGEARHDFLMEAAVFGAILATAVLPLIDGAHAVMNLARATGGF